MGGYGATLSRQWGDGYAPGAGATFEAKFRKFQQLIAEPPQPAPLQPPTLPSPAAAAQRFPSRQTQHNDIQIFEIKKDRQS
ncbi:protein of unknown function (plasmid) [Cupriavidus taiwanensis]|uniref:Uncharacterized protein n=1 Tax=Cupriavidus taiwanensis TaxID=164546 RepID=A0A375IRU6_9BURK|nr:protein of unknown function [Cupriavidus taiwanensis]